MNSVIRQLPNALTALRGGAGVLGALLLLESARASIEPEAVRLALASGALLLVAALSDGLDGWLARRLDAETALGALLDPIADKVLVDAYLIAYVILSGFDFWLALPVAVIVSRDVMVTAVRLVRPASGTLSVTPTAKYKTAAQMIVTALPFVLVLIGLRDPALWYHYWIGGVWFLALLTAWSAWPYLRAAAQGR